MDWKKLIVPGICLVVGFGIGSGIFTARGHRIATELERELDTSRELVSRTRTELAAAIAREQEAARTLERTNAINRELEQRNRDIAESLEREGAELSIAIRQSRTVAELVAAVRSAIDAVILAAGKG